MDPKKLMTVINKCFFQPQTQDNNINNVCQQYNNEMNLTHISAIFHKSMKHHVRLEILPLVERLDFLLNENMCDCNCQHISNLLYAVRNTLADQQHIQVLLITITKIIVRCTSSIPTAQNVGNSLLGLSGLDSKENAVRSLLRELIPLLSKCPETLTSQNISNALYSLLNFDVNDGVEVESLIVMLTKQINRSSSSLSGQSLTNSLYSLQNMNSKNKIVRKLMLAITRLVLRGKPEIASGQLIGNSLYGLSNSRTINYEVRELLAACKPHFEHCRKPILSQHLSNALLGMQGMSTFYPIVKLIVTIINKLFSQCDETFTSQGLGNSCYGLQNLESNTVEVQGLLRALTQKINECEYEMKAQEICNAIFGLQSCSNEDCIEVRHLVRAIERKLTQSSEKWTVNHIQQIFGLQLMTASPEVIDLVKSIKNKILTSECDSFDGLQQIGNAIYGLNRLYDSSQEANDIAHYLLSKVDTRTFLNLNLNEKDFRAFVHGLVPLTETSDRELRTKSKILLSEMLSKEKLSTNEVEELSTNERQCQEQLVLALKERNDIKSITSNKFILGYSYDMLIEKSEAGVYDEEMKNEIDTRRNLINIEIDGPTHNSSKSKHFHDIRDSYLKANGISVLRYDLMDESYSFDDFLILVKAYIE